MRKENGKIVTKKKATKRLKGGQKSDRYDKTRRLKSMKKTPFKTCSHIPFQN